MKKLKKNKFKKDFLYWSRPFYKRKDLMRKCKKDLVAIVMNSNQHFRRSQALHDALWSAAAIQYGLKSGSKEWESLIRNRNKVLEDESFYKESNKKYYHNLGQ